MFGKSLLVVSVVFIIVVNGAEAAKVSRNSEICNDGVCILQATKERSMDAEETSHLQVNQVHHQLAAVAAVDSVAANASNTGITCGRAWGDQCKDDGFVPHCCLLRSKGCDDGLECRATTGDFNPCNSCSKPAGSISSGDECKDNSECASGLTCAYFAKKCCSSTYKAVSWEMCTSYLPNVATDIIAGTMGTAVCAAGTAGIASICSALGVEGGPAGVIAGGVTCGALGGVICEAVVSASTSQTFVHMIKDKDYEAACNYMAYGRDACSKK